MEQKRRTLLNFQKERLERTALTSQGWLRTTAAEHEQDVCVSGRQNKTKDPRTRHRTKLLPLSLLSQQKSCAS